MDLIEIFQDQLNRLLAWPYEFFFGARAVYYRQLVFASPRSPTTAALFSSPHATGQA